MATTAAAQTRDKAAEASLRWGSWLMGIAAVGFIGYAVIFLVRNSTDSFLELGIGPNEVPVGKDAIQQFSPELFHYISHLHIATVFIAATGLAVLFAYGVRRELWAWVGAVAAPVLGWRWRCRPLPQPLRHPGPPGTHLPGHRDLRGRGAAGAAGDHHPASRLRLRHRAKPSSGGAQRSGPTDQGRNRTDASTSNPAVRQVRRGHRRLEVRHLRVGRPRARPRPPPCRLRPLLHATVRRLRPGRRPLHLCVACPDLQPARCEQEVMGRPIARTEAGGDRDGQG